MGDLAYRIPVVEANELISRLQGRKILVKGNHDKRYDPSLFEEICDYKEFSLNEYHIILMHYPLMSWKRSRYGSIHLHGHIHSTPVGYINQQIHLQGECSKYDVSYNAYNKSKSIRRYDVGVDANKFQPVSLDEIIRYMSYIAKE